MEQLHDESKLFDAEEQAAILRLACQLQSTRSGRVNLSELEAMAAEAGIEPQYVREAASHLSRGAKGNVRSGARTERMFSIAGTSLAIFLALQMVMAAQFVHPDFASYLPRVGIPMLLFSAVLLGLTFGRESRGGIRAAIIACSSLVGFSIVFAALATVTVGRTTTFWWPELPILAALEALAALAGGSWRHFRAAFRPNTVRATGL